jgi:predicted nuclease with TOPRIM domain
MKAHDYTKEVEKMINDINTMEDKLEGKYDNGQIDQETLKKLSVSEELSVRIQNRAVIINEMVQFTNVNMNKLKEEFNLFNSEVNKLKSIYNELINGLV